MVSPPRPGLRAYHGLMKISATPAVDSVIGRVRSDGRENLVMVLSNGCCDSTAPYLYDNYIPEPDSTPVGEVAGVSVVAPAWLVRLYPGDQPLTIDVEEGVIEDSLSLETEFDCRFVLRAPAAVARP